MKKIIIELTDEDYEVIEELRQNISPEKTLGAFIISFANYGAGKMEEKIMNEIVIRRRNKI